MNCRRETVEKGVPARHASKARRAGHRATAGSWIRGVLEQYVAGSDARGRPEGRSYLRSQQAIHEISGLTVLAHLDQPPFTESQRIASCDDTKKSLDSIFRHINSLFLG